MLTYLESFTSGVRWGLFALLVTFLIIFFEGSGMLSTFTKDKPKLQKACSYLFVITLIITISLLVIWIWNPAVDNTASQLSQINQSVQDLTDKIDRLIQVLEAQNVSGNSTATK